ncbi:EFR1 family ferrodoxin [Caloranaerobacter sp. TR13]|uniref:EFR1 family ferrodoxin n=1 Tax=Caloranaerobacter sp. TR13 TaxID=1302151 RepID=UPI0006D421D3|nr:EFR1 family ferrodoxin [Caloranaerobacter sp. TR13]
MKALILYFSATGNTYFIANLIYEKFKANGFDVELESIEVFSPNDVEKCDILIFGFPVYAFDMPLFLQSYINNLSFPKTRGVILFSTMGLYGGNSSRKTSKRFIKKGFVPLGCEEFKMPGSDGLAFMKKDSKFVKKVLSKNYSESRKIKESINKIFDIVNSNNLSDESQERNAVIPRLKISGLILDVFMRLFFNHVEKKMKGKFWVDDKCTKCGLCKEICPAKNIKISDGRVEFLDKCYLCMRCVHQCSTEAIQIGKSTVDKFRWKGPDMQYNPYKILNK